MNCTQAERCILLAETGELSSREQDCLQKHLGSCAACREFQFAMAPLRTSVRSSLPVTDLQPVDLDRLMAAVETAPVERVPTWSWHFLRPVPALAAAALVVLLIGGSVFWQRSNLGSGHLASQRATTSLYEQLAGSVDEGLDAIDAHLLYVALDDANSNVASTSAPVESDDLDSVVNDLLDVEGVSI